MGLEGILKLGTKFPINILQFPEIPDVPYQDYLDMIISFPVSAIYGVISGLLVGGALGDLLGSAEEYAKGFVWSIVRLALYSAASAVAGYVLANQGWIMGHALMWFVWSAYRKTYKVMCQNDMDLPIQELDLKEEILDYLEEEKEVYEDE